ncbi:MAG: hypothetical protein K9L23_17530 [Desulfotignum sp.]|nr:hypothetical protein [Desulfotignum sp.]MCF8089848.1 hypothetical protein [Desulfotignum sp.]
MYKIGDFNSLWEISFAINAIFIFFELQPVLEKKFIGMQTIGSDAIERFIKKDDQRYVNTYAWKSLSFAFVVWLGRLKLYSIVCSLLSITLIIIGGFNPNFSFGFIGICVLIIIQFLPIVVIPSIILYLFPKYKLRCINEAIGKLIEKQQNDADFIDKHLMQYQYLVDYINLFRLPFSVFQRTKKKISNKELFDIFDN